MESDCARRARVRMSRRWFMSLCRRTPDAGEGLRVEAVERARGPARRCDSESSCWRARSCRRFKRSCGSARVAAAPSPPAAPATDFPGFERGEGEAGSSGGRSGACEKKARSSEREGRRGCGEEEEAEAEVPEGLEGEGLLWSVVGMEAAGGKPDQELLEDASGSESGSEGWDSPSGRGIAGAIDG